MRTRVLIAVLIGLLLAACGDKTTINNYSLGATGVLTGSVDPPIPKTAILLDDNPTIYYTDSLGNFVILDVESGLHSIEVRPPHLSKRRLTDITVWPTQVTTLGEITLSEYPYPVYRTTPADGDSGVYVSRGGQFAIYTDEPLEIADLDAFTTITPAIPGGWHASQKLTKGAAYYSYYDESQRADLNAGIAYRVKIDRATRMKSGEPLGADIEFAFRTEPLSVRVTLPSGGLDGGVPLWSFTPVLEFNDSVNVDSVGKAVSFAPEITGMWLWSSKSYYEPRISFLPTSGPLQPATHYTMTVSDRIPLAGAATLPLPYTVAFTSEPIGVVSVSPCNGCVTNWGNAYVEFNASMQRSSVESAFSVSDESGLTIAGTYSWQFSSTTAIDREVAFTPKSPLTAGEVYKITVTTAARTKVGQNIAKEWVSYFLVQ